jgi:hypothetical protein
MATDNDVDYRQYSHSELLEALANIDGHRFPQNYERLVAEITLRNSGGGSERAHEVPTCILRLLNIRRNVAVSFVTKAIYAGVGAFYFCMPLFIIWILPRFIYAPDWTVGWAVAGTAMIWAVAGLYLFGLCVTYRLESGVIKCLWFGRYLVWQDKLATLADVKSNFIKGLPTVYLVWPDHKRRLWIRVSDLELTATVA